MNKQRDNTTWQMDWYDFSMRKMNNYHMQDIKYHKNLHICYKKLKCLLYVLHTKFLNIRYEHFLHRKPISMCGNTPQVEASSWSFLMYGKPPINGATECQRSPHFVGIQARNDKLLHIMWFRALKKETQRNYVCITFPLCMEVTSRRWIQGP